jgi:hypothetical protein
MRAEVSRIYDMGARVGSFSDTEPDTDPGQTQSVAEVKGLVQQIAGRVGQAVRGLEAKLLKYLHTGILPALTHPTRAAAWVVSLVSTDNGYGVCDSRQCWAKAEDFLCSQDSELRPVGRRRCLRSASNSSIIGL